MTQPTDFQEVDLKDHQEDGYLDVSLESDRLDPDQKAAHEADTLPMDADKPKDPPAADAAGRESRLRQISRGLANRAENAFSPAMTSRTEAPAAESSKLEHVSYALKCPPHGVVARWLTKVVVVLSIWGCVFALFGSIAAPPHGSLFWVLVVTVLAIIVGTLVSYLKLPPLLGMLLAGLVVKNIPGVDFDKYWTVTSGHLRGLALVVILMRAGLGLDPVALKKLSGVVLRLAFTPCTVEATAVAVSSHLLLGLPWLWGFMLGFVMAAVSPAVVVPCLLKIQNQGYGVEKGIPTLVIAAASVDDVLAISAFTILLGVAFKSDGNLIKEVFQVIEMIMVVILIY